ncbi:hypothetical protein CVT24_012454 [Panaeolus cyanescens]|uniref:Uncharacterized protein n=1 Tax=Panaeolus cyanescens TaxID=181874 RepID=A0A409WZ62_9AGAR|nr:hypothetical protein CVT24_012454 [Panaeolus cyanescens]
MASARPRRETRPAAKLTADNAGEQELSFHQREVEAATQGLRTVQPDAVPQAVTVNPPVSSTQPAESHHLPSAPSGPTSSTLTFSDSPNPVHDNHQVYSAQAP